MPIAIIIIFSISIIIILPDESYALTRADVAALDVQVADARESVEDLEESISEQNDLIEQHEEDLAVKRAELKETKRLATGSWDAVKEVDAAEAAVSAARSAITDAKRALIDLLNEKSDLVAFISDAGEELDAGKRLLSYQAGSNANLESLRKLIGVDIARSCHMLLEDDSAETTCPPIGELMQLDSSVPHVTGAFVSENGTSSWHREPSEYEESWRWYDTDDQIRIIVAPPPGMADRIPMITITNNLGVYFTATDMKLHNNTRTWHQDVYVEKCMTATVNADTWKESVPYLIWSMRQGCTDDLLETHSEVIVPAEIDLEASPSWQYAKWLEGIKSGECAASYGACK